MSIVDQYSNPISSSKFAHAARLGTGGGWRLRTASKGTADLIPGGDRRTIAALSSRLVFNMGPAKEAIRQKASYAVGEAFEPDYLGPDQEAGALAIAWMKENFFPRVDVRGTGRDWWNFLELASKAIDREGEHFAMPTLHDDGYPAAQHVPAYMFRSESADDQAHAGAFDGARIEDGVLYGAGGVTVGFRLYRSEKDYQDIDSLSLIHSFDEEFVDQGRGFPAFAHALGDLKNSLTSKELETIRQNLVSSIFLTEKRAGPLDGEDPRFEGRNSESGEGLLHEVVTPGIRHLTSDEELSSFTHDAPGDIWMSFQTRLWREALSGAGWSIALVLNPEGQGTAHRSEIVRARLAVNARQKKLAILAGRLCSYASAVGAGMGAIPYLKSMRWSFSKPARLTVDDGREAKALGEAVTAGRVTENQYQQFTGRTAEQHFRELKREEELKAAIMGPAEILLPDD